VTPARKQIMEALLAQLKGTADFKTVARKMRLWSDVSDAERPALFLWEPSDNYTWKNDISQIVRLKVEVYVYLTPSTDPDDNPIDAIDAVLDEIDAVLKPSTGPDLMMGRNTLNNLVYHVQIDGEVIKSSGDISNISILIVPVTITVAQRNV
jgi:hypothetical protein